MKKMSSTIIKGLIVAMLGIGLFSSTPSANAQAGIPAGATITSATLFIYSNTPINYPVYVHRITASWAELGVTWNNFNASYDSAVVDTLLPSAAGWHSADITALMQEWVDGTAPNYGILLEQGRTPYTSYYSSEYGVPALRPKFEICYTAAGISNTCVTIQRPAANHVDVYDSYIRDLNPDGNYGNDTILYTGVINEYLKQTLIRFDFNLLNPAVSIVKYTNGQVANDPDGADVPEIKPGDPVTWTYVVTNTGNVPVPAANLSVTDDQTGVTPVFDHEISGNGDSVFDAGEVWSYKATGVAVDLTIPPGGVKVTQGVCTHDQTQPARTAYVNQGTASIPGASSTAKSSYCNPLFKVYFPVQNGKPAFDVKGWHVSVGFEDLPLASGENDYDYNDWITDIDGFADFDVRANNGLSEIIFNFNPQARGALYDHTFHIAIPAGTFGSDGTAVLTIFDQNHQVLSSQTSAFVASADTDFVIFPNTSAVFPNLANTFESVPSVPAQRYASLDITFSQPAPFDLASYNLALPHGGGLFFDPYLYVHNTGDTIHRGDIRMLTVPDTSYKWPEEKVRIDKAYPNVTFVAGNPPTINFPNMWWLNFNHCVYDGIACALSKAPSAGTVAPGTPVVTPGTPTATSP